MPSKTKIVVVAGANGALGKLICSALLERAKRDGESVLVRGLVRKGRVDQTDTGASEKAVSQQLIVEPVDYRNEADVLRVCASVDCR